MSAFAIFVQLGVIMQLLQRKCQVNQVSHVSGVVVKHQRMFVV